MAEIIPQKLNRHSINRMKKEMMMDEMMDEAIASAELAGADMEDWKEKVRRDYMGLLSDEQIEATIRYWQDILDQQKKEIGEEFKKWFLKGTEMVEDAIERITNVKV